MKKTIPVIAVVVIAIIVSLSLFFLVLEPQMKQVSVVGTYSRNDNSGSMQLNSDGSVFIQTQGNTAGVSGTWKLVNGNMVQVSFTLLGTPVTYQYNLVGNQLVSTSDSTNVLTKQGSTSNTTTPTPTPTSTLNPTSIPTSTAIVTAAPTTRPTNSPQPTSNPTATNSPAATASPTPTPTPSPTASPTPTASPSPTPTASPTPTPSPTPSVGYARSNPAPTGTALVTMFPYSGTSLSLARVTVLETVRGTEAWTRLLAANMFNTPPTTGNEYILVKIRFEYTTGLTAQTSYTTSPVYFKAISESGSEYTYISNVPPSPSLSTSLYPGASIEGWAAYQVAITDTHPLLAFARNYDGTGGIWFKLY